MKKRHWMIRVIVGTWDFIVGIGLLFWILFLLAFHIMPDPTGGIEEQ